MNPTVLASLTATGSEQTVSVKGKTKLKIHPIAADCQFRTTSGSTECFTITGDSVLEVAPYIDSVYYLTAVSGTVIELMKLD